MLNKCFLNKSNRLKAYESISLKPGKRVKDPCFRIALFSRNFFDDERFYIFIVTDMVATCLMWLLNIRNVTNATEEVNFSFTEFLLSRFDLNSHK